MRELGNRPRSGLWQRKTGRCGRKIYKMPPMAAISEILKPKEEPIKLTLSL